MHNIGDGSSSFPDFGDSRANRYPLGFMNLLGVHQDITHSDTLMIHTQPMKLSATPNSSSISSNSSEALTRDKQKKRYNKDVVEDQEEHHKRNKRCKSMKISVPKVSFITKSEVDNLDDGYKWRKYGQKPVRNSPFPRNYYRCTISWCDVKKRVERSSSDPNNVITTYEGQHTHPSPHMILSKNSNFGGSNVSPLVSQFSLPSLPPQLHQQQQQHQELPFFESEYLNKQENQELSFFGTEYLKKQENGFGDDDVDDDHVMKKSRPWDLLDGAGLVKDHGLLEDVVSSHIFKK